MSRSRPDHPLWTMPDVLLTPHMAGCGYLDDRRYQIITDNRALFLSTSRCATWSTCVVLK